jgi:hypothetical protein
MMQVLGRLGSVVERKTGSERRVEVGVTAGSSKLVSREGVTGVLDDSDG